MVGLRLLDEVELEMHPACAHLAPGAGVVDVLGHEHGVVVAGPEGLELLEYAEELGGDLGEVEPGVDVDHRCQHVLRDVRLHVGVHAVREFLELLLPEGESGGVDVSAEVFEQVGAAFNRAVEVESGDASG